jgi:uncharacterized protein (DUF305 family)
MRQATAALAVTVTVALAGCGSDEPTTEGAKGNGTDRAFVAAMIPHHESAVEMAKIAETRAESSFVKELSADVIRTQTEEIAILRREDAALAEAGVKAGKLAVQEHTMGMDQDPEMLKSADPFDAAFIKMMIPHHEGAIEMAQEELNKGADPELIELAQNIVDAQQREVDEMVEHTKGAADSEHSSDHDS